MLRYKYRKIFMTIIISLLLTGCANQQSENVSVVKYEDKEYVELEYPQSIFYYDYNGNPHDNFEEVDGIYPIDSPKWEVIWNGGDLYCIKDRAEEAKEYYASDANYVWYLFIGDEAVRTDKELIHLFLEKYGIDVLNDFYEGDDHYDDYIEAQNAIAEGYSIYGGSIAFEDDGLADLAEKVWDHMEREKHHKFRRINTMLEE